MKKRITAYKPLIVYKKLPEALYNILKFTGKPSAKMKCNYIVCLTIIKFPFVAVKQINFLKLSALAKLLITGYLILTPNLDANSALVFSLKKKKNTIEHFLWYIFFVEIEHI